MIAIVSPKSIHCIVLTLIIISYYCINMQLQVKIVSSWKVPKYTWVNGVLGCGKLTWIVRNFDNGRDVVLTSTTEATNYLRGKIASQYGEDAKIKVRTIASVLVNDLRGSEKKRCERRIIDEALVHHFGAIALATKLAEAKQSSLYEPGASHRP